MRKLAIVIVTLFITGLYTQTYSDCPEGTDCIPLNGGTLQTQVFKLLDPDCVVRVNYYLWVHVK
jgi:hypothetical protein